MQHSVDIVSNSDHPTSKVSATIFGHDSGGKPYTISRINHWPEIIKTTFGTEGRIGNASGTIHAETDCIIHAPRVKDAEIFITDPPCPNCVKNMAESGVKSLYIDHKGFDKDFAKRRSSDFETMSMRICQKAGIGVYVVYRKEERIECIFKPPEGYVPPIENPAIIEPYNQKSFDDVIEHFQRKFADLPIACALAKDTEGKEWLIGASTHPVAGYTSETLDEKSGKYSYVLQPLNRAMMAAARHGFRLHEPYIYSSRVPTSRELVNFVGAGLHTLMIGNPKDSRDPESIDALGQLVAAKIIKVA